MSIPLSERMRPKQLSDLAGQEHLTQENGYLAATIRSKIPHSILLFGPPGCGKTTLAHLYAASFPLPFLKSTAVFQSVQDIKKFLKEGQDHPLFSRKTILFVDEIHRFNRTQQDLFLPFLEDGSLILIGATTENPSFSLGAALLSRMRVLQLHPLDPTALRSLLKRYETLCSPLPLDEESKETMLTLAQGDGRHLFNLIENLEAVQSKAPLSPQELLLLLQKRPALYDKNKENHHNLISALHKAVRGSDPDAALYWLARMLEGGEEPLFILRRMIRMASEDIGLADPQALSIVIAARDAFEQLGSPEGELALAQALIYLAAAPKSNAIYTAFDKAKELAAKTGHLSPPSIILNAPTSLMAQMGYGKGYLYDHDAPDGFSGQNYFPPELERTSFYTPVERGFEREMKKRLDYFNALRKKR